MASDKVEWAPCAAGQECTATYGPGKSIYIPDDDTREWACGCVGHKDCFKEGLYCEQHGIHPFAVGSTKDD